MFARKSSRKSSEMPCIFVHAGAGYHSKDNEAHHLQACADACKSAMYVMKNGGTAVDAVEMAIRCLEDREITNAGYGSNPNIEGVVECDAIVVDHFGRSGAAGSVAQIKNPVSLARVLLDSTSEPLSLRRVPPNLLVGQGATDFAHEHGIPILPHMYLVSPMARNRWQKWRVELARAEGTSDSIQTSLSNLPDLDFEKRDNEVGDSEAVRQTQIRSMLAGLSQMQPLSPPTSDHRNVSASTPQYRSSSLLSYHDQDHSLNASPGPDIGCFDQKGSPGMLENAHCNPFANSTQNLASSTSPLSGATSPNAPDGSSHRLSPWQDGHLAYEHAPSLVNAAMDLLSTSSARPAESASTELSEVSRVAQRLNRPFDARILSQGEDAPGFIATSPFCRNLLDPSSHCAPPAKGEKAEGDHITDTIGAIAIDSLGNIACAASSGGIGMKHRGRVGPAALIGIGAAIIPIDLDDEDQATVATVTSGTGEHMATTMAASVCSDRVYQSHRKGKNGVLEQCNEDEAIAGFIKKDFLDHPSVKRSHSAGAVGVLSVRKTDQGCWLYFGHNTDSFALASMHNDESRPVCTMSRNGGSGAVAQGGRAIRFRRTKR